MDQHISLVTLGVTDLARARAFYEALGWGGAQQRAAFGPRRVGGTTGAFADPDGYVWKVAHNPGWILDEDGAVQI